MDIILWHEAREPMNFRIITPEPVYFGIRRSDTIRIDNKLY